MSQSYTCATLLDRFNGLLHRHLADFSDADLMVRPVEGANHAAWQLLHCLKTSTGMANGAAPDAAITFPAKYAPACDKAAAASDDPHQFPGKDEILQLFGHLLLTLKAEVEKMSEERLAGPSPEQFIKFAPTVAELVLMIPLHTTMHVGQIQVIRRKLKKTVLF